MNIILSILKFLLSIFNSIWEVVWNFLIKNRKYISYLFYFLSILSLLYLWNTDNKSIGDSWDQALFLLRFILFLPIFANVLNFSIAKKLMVFRKEIWILMWVLVIVHSAQYFFKSNNLWFWEYGFWFQNWEITYLAWWFMWTVIAIILTITSNNTSIKSLGRVWKLLHRLVYFLLIFTLLHIIYLEGVWFEMVFLFPLYVFWKILEWKSVELLKSKYK